MQLNVSGTTFVQQLERLAQQVASTPATVSGVLRVPEEHAWWYYQEMGWPAGYPIFPRNAKYLAWTDAEGHHVVGYVHEWGSDTPGAGRALYFVTDAKPEIKALLQQRVEELLASREFDLISTVLFTDILPSAKELILANIKERLPGSRQAGPGKGESAGKLGGRTAAEVLETAIAIEED